MSPHVGGSEQHAGAQRADDIESTDFEKVSSAMASAAPLCGALNSLLELAGADASPVVSNFSSHYSQ